MLVFYSILFLYDSFSDFIVLLNVQLWFNYFCF